VDRDGTRPVCKDDDDVTILFLNFVDEQSNINENGFSIDIQSSTKTWDCFFKEIGIHKAYNLISKHLCNRYLSNYGEEFLFSDSCVAYEIEYHADAYMWTQNYSGYSRNITTYLFSRETLIEHCKTIEIFTSDVYNFKQSLCFDYYNGIRDCYKGTDREPYERIYLSV